MDASWLLLTVITGIVDSLQRHVVARGVGVWARTVEISIKAAVLPESMSTKRCKLQPWAVGACCQEGKGQRVGLPGTSSSNHAKLGYPCTLGSRTRRQISREQLAHAAGSRFTVSKVDAPNTNR